MAGFFRHFTRQRLVALALTGLVALALLYQFRHPVRAWARGVYKSLFPILYPPTYPIRSSRPESPRARRVLFIGNSYTFYNQMPFLLEEFSARDEHPLSVAMLAVPAWNLSDHRRAGAQHVIRKGRWDVVVLQEHSLGALENPAQFRADARALIDAITSAGAQPVLYQTWSRRADPELQARLSAEFSTLSKETGARVAPVGDVWHALRTADAPPALYTFDGSHPTPAGSYAAACTFYAALTGRSPRGLPAALVLRGIAYPATFDDHNGLFALPPEQAEQIHAAIEKLLLDSPHQPGVF